MLESQACNSIKTRLQNRCFFVNIAKFSRTPNMKNILERSIPQCLPQCVRKVFRQTNSFYSLVRAHVYVSGAMKFYIYFLYVLCTGIYRDIKHYGMVKGKIRYFMGLLILKIANGVAIVIEIYPSFFVFSAMHIEVLVSS